MAGAAPGTTFGADFMPNHLNLQTFITCQTGSWSCQCVSFFYWPETAGCSLQTLQTFRNLPNWRLELPNYGCGKPSLSFSTGPKLPDGPIKRSEPPKLLETCQASSWSCQTMGCGKPFLLARNCRMVPSNANAPNAPKLARCIQNGCEHQPSH